MDTSEAIATSKASAEEYRKLIDLYSTLYSFPREVGLPRKIVPTLADFLSFLITSTGNENENLD
jgi:hypothetical protein